MSSKSHVVIIGLMGVGKSTLGRTLADALSTQYIDSDDDISRLFGAPGSAIAERFGVQTLHRIESGVLLGALAREEPAVITAAASVVEDPIVREVVAHRAEAVWIHAELTEVLRRQSEGYHRRPMAYDELSSLAEVRRPLFAEMADIEVVADGEPDQVATYVLKNLQPRQSR